VALNQPGEDYFGGMGQWEDIVSSIAKIGTAYVTSTLQPSATANQQTMANNLAMLRAQQGLPALPAQQVSYLPAVSTPITSSPFFIPLVAGLGVILIVMVMGGKR